MWSISKFGSRFIEDINRNPLYRNGNKFVCKLPFTTNSQHGSTVKFAVGFEGIMEMLGQLRKNVNISGYISYAMIQPEIPENCEAKIICFNGKARFRNKHKKSRDGRSPFAGVRDKEFFEFAEHVITVMRRVCPQLISDQVLRIDIFGFRNYPGMFIVNEIEGYEAQRTATGSKAGELLSALSRDTEEYWFDVLTELIEYHLNHNV